jgi:CubicO group peptidase (beta-lactamase class C family)
MTPPGAPAAKALYFPPATGDDWEALNVSDNGWSDSGLADLASYCESHNSTSLVVTQAGRLLFEQYWKGVNRHTATDIASAQKSVTSLLVGTAAADGHLTLDDPVAKFLGAGWSGSPSTEPRITVRHLLTMTSGLTDQFTFQAEPGTRWYYNTTAYQMLGRVLAAATKTTVDDWTDRKLGKPIGWHDAVWKDRAKRQLPDGSPERGLALSARDAARFGLLVLGGGAWAGTQVVPAAYLDEALTPSTTFNASYGLLWWLNGKASYELPGPRPTPQAGSLIPAAPADLVAAMGALDQRIYVVPSRQWVIVRQGLSANAGEAGAEALSGLDAELWKRVMAAAPK